MLRDQPTLGRIPLLIVSATMLMSYVISGLSYQVLAREPALIAHQEVTSVQMVAPRQFSAEYHQAIGQRFLRSYANWNRFNFARQFSNATAMSDESVQGLIRAEYRAKSETINSLKISRKTDVEDVSVKWSDPKTRTSQIRYLVHVDEWWGSLQQDERWLLYTIELRDIEPQLGQPLVALVIGVLAKDVTDQVRADRGLTGTQHRQTTAVPAGEEPATPPAPPATVPDPITPAPAAPPVAPVEAATAPAKPAIPEGSSP